VFLTFIPDVSNVHERPHTSFRFVYAHQQHHNMSTFSTPYTSLQTLLSPVDPTTDRDPSSISISIHLREELHRTSSRDLSKQCPLCFETLLTTVWRVEDASTSWDMAYRDPCRKPAYSAKVEIRGRMGYGQTRGLVSFGLSTSAPAAGAQRVPGSPTAPRDLAHVHEPSR
jgi:hypothetical protein